MRAILIIAIPMFLLAVATPTLGPSAASESPYGKPIYNPATKSYFELRGDNVNPGVWSAAQARARTLKFKGVPGRLAIVDSIDTHRFLARNFKIDQEAWIGLRYWCTFRKLQWVTGDVLELGTFSAWAATWHRSDLPPCESAGTKETGYMSVYYRATPDGFRWQAVGSAKGFSRYFVEYPTGHE